MEVNIDLSRNRRILERRRAGESIVSLAADFGLSRSSIHQIAIKEQRAVERELELQEADRLPQQPNALHLSPRLRRTLQRHFGREHVSPLDILEIGFREGLLYKIANFQRKYWRELVQWMARAGFSPDP